MKQLLFLLIVGSGLLGNTTIVHAEPYLVLRQGVNCSSCHTNPTGGGKRNAFGRVYGQTLMPATPSEVLLIIK